MCRHCDMPARVAGALYRGPDESCLNAFNALLLGVVALVLVLCWMYSNGPEVIVTGGALARPAATTTTTVAATETAAAPVPKIAPKALPRPSKPRVPPRAPPAEWIVEPPSPPHSSDQRTTPTELPAK